MTTGYRQKGNSREMVTPNKERKQSQVTQRKEKENVWGKGRQPVNYREIDPILILCLINSYKQISCNLMQTSPSSPNYRYLCSLLIMPKILFSFTWKYADIKVLSTTKIMSPCLWTVCAQASMSIIFKIGFVGVSIQTS